MGRYAEVVHRRTDHHGVGGKEFAERVADDEAKRLEPVFAAIFQWMNGRARANAPTDAM
ncbi:MAG TPA: hypothetical protein VGD42_19265 [Lysobacter sp.]